MGKDCKLKELGDPADCFNRLPLARSGSIHSASNKDGFLRRTFCFSLVAALVLVTAHRLPAPISEIPEPTATPKVKPKPARDVKAEGRPNVESRDAKSNPAHSFNGVWEGSSDTTTE